MAIVKIEGKEYDYDTLPEDVKNQVMSLQFVDSEINKLQSQIAVFKTARMAYIKALNQALQAPIDPLAQQLAGDTIKLA